MRVSCGKLRMRPSAATRSSWGSLSPEKNRAWPRTSAASICFSLFSDNLPELRELVFLHEHGVLRPGVAAGADVVAGVAQALLDDRHQIHVDLGVPRHGGPGEGEQARADDVHAVRAVSGAERDQGDRQGRGEVL